MRFPVPWRRRASFSVFLLAIVAWLPAGCGREDDPEGAFPLDGASAFLRPADAGACQHYALCVPENPCHVGQVTGCRRGVPICTDIGAWLPNGTSCGEDHVCRRGECMFCDEGAACTPLDAYGQPIPCATGAIACATGVPVCKYVGPAADGTSCSADPSWVCKDATCTWCVDGASCALQDQPCRQGVLQACSSGGTCVDSGYDQPNGTWCGDNMVCNAGTCNACAWWTSCDPANECVAAGYTDCSTGSAVCLPSYYQPDGTPCGDGGMCWSGQCGPPCTSGEVCKPTELPCYWGYTLCSASGAWCPAWYLEPDGTPCPGGTCQWGQCVVSCTPGEPCRPDGSACSTGERACDGGTNACVTTWTAADGASCGPANETCSAGACRGAAGNPLLVQGANGAPVAVAGLAFGACYAGEPVAGMSRLAADRFGEADFTHADLVFPFSLDCTGPTAGSLGMIATGSAYTEGDRLVGWTESPPNGLPSTVTATATYLYGFTDLGDVTSVKFLFFVDDRWFPWGLHDGEPKDVLAPDGYATALAPDRRDQLPPCVPDGACQGMGGACRTWSVGCDAYAPACVEAGFAPDLTPCGGAGETCLGGACSAPAGSAWIVRTTAGGFVDLTGTGWAECRPDEPDWGMSRWKANTFYAGGVIAIEAVYPNTTCSGDPTKLWQGDLTVTLGGDRWAGWRGSVPAGVAATLWTTGIELSGVGPEGNPFVAKDLVLVDVDASPWRFYTGEDDNPTLLDAEGYPAYMLDGYEELQ